MSYGVRMKPVVEITLLPHKSSQSLVVGLVLEEVVHAERVRHEAFRRKFFKAFCDVTKLLARTL